MRIATFLPHTGVYGGVRRLIELGNAWTALGHEVTLYHPSGEPPSWLPYRGRTRPLAAAAGAASDLAVGADPHTLDAMAGHRAALHLYYCVIEGDPGVIRAAADPRLLIAANSGALRRSLARRLGRPVLDGAGGIDTARFHPAPPRPALEPLRVLLNGRRSRRKKGTDLALAALAGLRGAPRFEVVLFDAPDPRDPRDPRHGARLPRNARYVLGPTQDELAALYRSADLFIAAERKAGWCNTALEAMASGVAVVCTRSGTTDFARHGETALVTWRHPWFLRREARRVLRDAALRARLAAAGPAEAARWTWDRLAVKLLDQLAARDAAPAQRAGR